MTGFTNELVSVFDAIDFSKILMFVFIPIISVLMLVAIIKIGCSVKEFIEKVVNIVVKDFKSYKNQRHKDR